MFRKKRILNSHKLFVSIIYCNILLIINIRGYNTLQQQSSPTLLYSTIHDIRLTDTSKLSRTSTIVKNLVQIHATDFYAKDKLICWGDHEYELIDCAHYNATYHVYDKFSIVTEDFVTPNGLAIDWITQKVYWTDQELHRIEVASIYTRLRRVLFWTDIDLVRAIAIVPHKGLLFWTDWGEMPKIERASMDGSSDTRKVIVKDNIHWPNGLTVDYQNDLIYWLDGNNKFIDVMDFDGNNRKRIVDGLVYPFALTYFERRLYWTDWDKWALYTWDLSTNGPIKELLKSQPAPVDIRVFDERRQPEFTSPCSTDNGNCSHLCLLSSKDPGYKCDCPTGVVLEPNSTTRCASGPQALLIIVQRNAISQISLDTPDYTPRVIKLKGLKLSVSVEYDTRSRMVYWADNMSKTISRARSDGTGGQEVIADNVAADCIAIDHPASQIYWTDAVADSISCSKLDGTSRKVVVFGQLYEPRALCVHSKAGLLFWSDWSERRPRIERSMLDGTRRTVIVSERLAWPNGLAIDPDADRLYWGDARTHKIEMSNLDGGDRRELHATDIAHIFSVSQLGDYVYWTDKQTRTLERVNKITGGDRQTIAEHLPSIFGVKAVDTRMAAPKTACSVNNNGCSHLCFNVQTSVVCGCPLGLELNVDGKTCVEPRMFLLYARKGEIGRIGVENRNNIGTLPIKDLKEVSALAVHVPESQVYWSDGKNRGIYRCTVNATNVEKIIDWSGYVEGIAIDWSGDNIYWTDSVLQRIEVSRLDGSSRKTLIWQGLKKPKSIALDPIRGFMYWSEYGCKCIKRARMDGTDQTTLVEQAGRAVSLTIDYRNRTLYWVSQEPPQVECSDLNGGGRRELVTASVSTLALAFFRDMLLSADWNSGNVSWANGGESIAEGVDSIMELRVWDTEEMDSVLPDVDTHRQCEVDNGGCQRLCLLSGASYTCACPTHYTLDPDNITCHGPEEYLLYYQRNTVGRVVDGDDCPDTVLQFPGYKSLKSVDYDPIADQTYWIEEEGGVRRSDGAEWGGPARSVRVDRVGRAFYWAGGTHLHALSLLGERHAHKANVSAKALHLALHDTRRVMVWIDIAVNSLIRAALDGTGQRELTKVYNVSALTIDQKRDVVYWSTSRQIYAIDLDGNNLRVAWQGGAVNSLAIVDDTMYWTVNGAISRMQLSGAQQQQHPAMPAHLNRIIALVAVSKVDRRHPCYAGGPCGSGAGACLAEGTCSCGATCVTAAPAVCSVGQFACALAPHHDKCIPIAWKCDGQVDCLDHSDEWECGPCAGGVRCVDGGCGDTLAACDSGARCDAGTQVFADAFRCGRVCLAPRLLCDGRAQCEGGEDEASCEPILPRRRLAAPIAVGVCALLLAVAAVLLLRRRRCTARHGRHTVAYTESGCTLRTPSKRLRPLGASVTESERRRRSPRDPPPSPASRDSGRRRPYRHYRAMNRPPPPTPCSTDACESDWAGPAPPPTPAGAPSCPPSPTSTYYAPYPPPPSPTHFSGS